MLQEAIAEVKEQQPVNEYKKQYIMTRIIEDLITCLHSLDYI
jgi:hypothetical protein